VDFDHAVKLLLELVDLRRADVLMPLGPAAIYTASVVLWLLVYQRLNHNCSLQEAVKHLLQTASELCEDNKRIREQTLSARTGSYSEARQRLTPEVTRWFADAVSTSIIETVQPSHGNRRVFLIDGTTITLAPTKALRAEFPPASNQHGRGAWPVALLTVAHELESGAALRPEVGPMYGPMAVSETALAQEVMRRIIANSILLADANFGIFAIAYAAVQEGHSYLLRLTKQRFGALSRDAELVSQGDHWKTWSLVWKPSPKDRQSDPQLPADSSLAVLIHEVQVHPELTLWLVTDLSDTALECAKLYGRRGEVETDISNIKVVLKTEEIRSTSVAMFQKELLTSMVAYNLVVQFRRQAAEKAGVPAKRLSFTGVWTTYRQFLMNNFSTEAAQWRERYRQALHYAALDKLPNRPGRSFTRCAYARRPKSNQFKKRPVPPDDIPSVAPK
jgi:hypothetical protein